MDFCILACALVNKIYNATPVSQRGQSLYLEYALPLFQNLHTCTLKFRDIFELKILRQMHSQSYSTTYSCVIRSKRVCSSL